MIQFTLHTQEGEKLRITAPHSWRELNLQQLIDIENEDLQEMGLIKLFSIVSGVNIDTVNQSTDRSLYDRVREVCAFVADPPDWAKLSFPTFIELDGKAWKSPKKVDELMHGQIELLTEIGKEDNLLNGTARAVAIIMQPYMDKKKNGKLVFDSERVDQIETEVLKSSGTDCLGFVQFFFLKLAAFLSIGIQSSKAYLKSKTRKPSYYSDWLIVNDYHATPV